MMVHSPLEIYAVALGLKYAQVSAAILWDTSLAFLPFLGLAIEAFHKMSTISFGNIWEASFRYTAFKFLMMLFTMGLCFVPLTTLKVTEIQYQPRDTQATVSKYGDTGTTYDESFQKLKLENIQLPVLLDGVLSIASGLAYAVDKEVPKQQDIGKMIGSVVVSRLPQALSDEVGEFTSLCYQPAITKFTNQHPDLSTYKNTMASYGGGSDLNWIGSHVLQKLYYPSIQTFQPIAPFPYNEFPLKTIQENGTTPPKSGFPTCQQWWTNSDYGLQDRIVQAIESYQPKNKHLSNGVSLTSEFSSWLDGMKSHIPFYDSTIQANLSKDIIIKEGLYNPDSVNYNHQIAGGQMGNGFGQTADRLIQGAYTAGSWIQSGYDSVVKTPGEESKVNATIPLIIAVSFFIVLLIFPWFMWGSGYSFAVFMTFAGILFSLIMAPVLMDMLTNFIQSVNASSSYFNFSFPNMKGTFNNLVVWMYYVIPFLLAGALGGIGYGAGSVVSGALMKAAGNSDQASKVAQGMDNGNQGLESVQNVANKGADTLQTAVATAVAPEAAVASEVAGTVGGATKGELL